MGGHARRAWSAGQMVVALALSWLMVISLAVDARAGDLAAGREKAVVCQPCHGKDGLSLRPDAPHIAGQNPFYMEEQLENYRSGARVHEVMSVIAEDLSDEDIADLVAYYSAIEVEVVKLPGE